MMYDEIKIVLAISRVPTGRNPYEHFHLVRSTIIDKKKVAEELRKMAELLESDSKVISFRPHSKWK